jgi:hypothetical protein
MSIPSNHYEITLKNNQYQVKISFVPGTGVDLKHVYSLDYFEEMGFFTSMVIHPTPEMEEQSGGALLYEKGEIRNIIRDKNVTFPFNVFSRTMTFLFRTLPSFSYSKASSLSSGVKFHEETEKIPADESKEVPVEEPKDEPKVVPVEEPKEESKEVPVEEPKEESKEVPVEEPKEVPVEEPKVVPVEEPKIVPVEEPKEVPVEEPKEVFILNLIPFDTKDRELDPPVSFKEYIQKRLEKRDERIQNQKGLTYSETIKWMDMLKMQRIHRMKKEIIQTQQNLEEDLYVLDGRLIRFGSYFKKDMRTKEVKEEELKREDQMEKELLGFVLLEGTQRIEDMFP